MRAKQLLLEISQDDLDIMAAAVTERVNPRMCRPRY